jgi:hypothetical protein
MEEEFGVTSKFNDAMYQIMRLNSMWLRCAGFRTSGRLEKWRCELEAVWGELKADALRDQKGVTPADNVWFKKILLQNKLISANKDNLKILYFCLDKKEEILRQLQDKSGKGAKYEEDDDGF